MLLAEQDGMIFLIAEKNHFRYDIFMRRFAFLILLIVFYLPVYAGEIGGKEYLKKGKEQLESRKYADAISSLSQAEKEYPLLGDYALLWLSDAYHEKGDHSESLKTIRILLKEYPNSPLEKKARVREIKEAEEISEDNIRQLFETYIKENSCDMEIKYFYAQWLKKNDQKDKARSFFKDIYVNAGSFSELAHGELDVSDIGAEDLVKRASNLIKAMDYKGAESALKSAMTKDDGSFKKEILKELGHSLFRQKRYPQAAEVFKQADEEYWEIRSRYRAGEKEFIHSSIDALLKSKDQRIGSVLVAIASDRRREGDNEGAIWLFQKVLERYPAENEDALWGIGWTHFLAGEYKKAADFFAKLYTMYNDPKYLYWKARSLEADGEDASTIYEKIIEKRPNFYNTVSYKRASGSQGRSGENTNLWATVKSVKSNPVALKKIDRIEDLLELGFTKDALSEMIFTSKKTNSIDDILYVCSKFNELGQYKYSVRLAAKVPYTRELSQFMYPLAYWDIVESISEKYGIDPLLALSIVREESRFDSDARSQAGALGLMQLMPYTAHQFDKKIKLQIDSSHDILDVKNNLNLGIFYLSSLIKEFGSYAAAIASYNAGGDMVKKWLQKGNYRSADEFIEDIPYNETRNYVKKVLSTFFEYKRIFLAKDGIIEIPMEKL